MKNFFHFLILIVANFLMAASLGAEPFKKPYQDYNIGCGKVGGKLIIPTTSDPKSFNPIVAQETSTTHITSYIFEGLTRTHPVTLEVMPNLAESWEMDEEGKKWIFKLRKDVRWNNGEKFTVKDVVFTFNKLIYNPEIPTGSRDTFTIEGKKILVEKIDDYTVRFTLPFKFAPFLRALSQDILPAHKYEPLVKEGKFSFALALDTVPQDIVGTGPFRLIKYLPGERVILEKNPFYYKKDSCGITLPYLKEIIFAILVNSDTSLLKFLEGEIDYYSLRPRDLGILGPEQAKGNFTIYNAGPALGSNFLILNQNVGVNPKTKKPFVKPYKLDWFQNKEFRQAISYAIDRQKIIDILMNGLGIPQSSPVTPANIYYHNPKVKTYPYNPDKTRSIFTNLGFKDEDGDGIIEDSSGRKVEINLFTSSNDNQRVQIASLVKKDLKKVGVRINFLPLDFNNLVNKLTATLDWEMILIGFSGGIEPYFGKNVWSYKGNLHAWNFSSKAQAAYEQEIEDIFNTVAKTLDEDERKKLYWRWQEIVAEELPLIYTVVPFSIYAVRNKFGNLYPTTYGGAFSEIEHIYINGNN